MPNWAYNLVKFNSEEDLFKAIKTFNPKCTATCAKEVKENDFSFDYIVPRPKTKEEYIEKYGEDFLDSKDAEGNSTKHLGHTDDDEWFDWYSWQCEFWGTKWNCCDTCIGSTYIYFQTAWNPAIPIYEAMGKLLPDIEFQCAYAEEQGAEICGRYFHTVGNVPDTLVEYDPESDEAYECYNEVEGETYYNLGEDGWHAEWEDGYIFFSKGEMHYFNTYDVSIENLKKAKQYHTDFGKDFDNFIIEYMEDNHSDFLKKAIGFVRVVEDFDNTPTEEYKTGVYE